MPKYGGKSGRIKVFKRANDLLHKKVKRALALSKSLLDVGCGKGAFMDYFKRAHGMHCTGIEIAENVGRPDLNIIYGSAHEMIFKDKQFDIVVHQDGMEHIPEEIERQVLSELFRVSRNYIYMTIAIHEVKHNDDKTESMGLGKVHCNMKSIADWEEILEDYIISYKVKDFELCYDKNWVYVYIQK
jgi:ubiquinone/menaquinone biosynthesis C-methylase UbiE